MSTLKEPNLMTPTHGEYACNLRGMAYVKNSKGQSSNVHFYIGVRIDTSNNSADVIYTIEMFKHGQEDYFRGDFTNYQQAVAKYNELATKWNGYRDM